VSPNRGSASQSINLASMGEQMNNHLNSFDGGTMVERVEGSILEENSNDESARDAASAIEEL
jgi:hypothetical protein